MIVKFVSAPERFFFGFSSLEVVLQVMNSFQPLNVTILYYSCRVKGEVLGLDASGKLLTNVRFF